MSEELRSIEEVREMLDCTQQGNVKQSAGNYRTVLLEIRGKLWPVITP